MMCAQYFIGIYFRLNASSKDASSIESTIAAIRRLFIARMHPDGDCTADTGIGSSRSFCAPSTDTITQHLTPIRS